MSLGFEVHPINKDRLKYGQYHTLFHQLRNDPVRFQQYTRLKIETFDYIFDKVKLDLEKKWCNLHNRPILPEEQLVVTLRYLATGSSYGDLAFDFRIGVSTISGLLERTMNIIWKNLYPTHMPVPTKEKLLEISKAFYYKTGFPHCLGAIDVRHVRIRCPYLSGSLYRNYKKFFSITLQAVVDSKYRYVFIDVGGYGRQHDSTTLKSSRFYKALQKSIIEVPPPDRLPNSTITAPYFFVGDGAYPLMKYLVKPYPGVYIPEDQVIFNQALCGARIVVECAFGQTCQKWRIFYTTIGCQPEKVELITKVTCLLHNIIIDKEGVDQCCDSVPVRGDGLVNLETIEEDVQGNFPVGNGYDLRELIKKYLNRKG